MATSRPPSSGGPAAITPTFGVEEVRTQRLEHYAVTCEGQPVLYTNQGDVARAMAATLNESRRLRADADSWQEQVEWRDERIAKLTTLIKVLSSAPSPFGSESFQWATKHLNDEHKTLLVEVLS